MLGSYSKLIGAVLGNLIGLLAVYLASKGLATCVPGATPDAEQVCTIAGMSTATITTTVMLAVNALFVWAFPANKPPA